MNAEMHEHVEKHSPLVKQITIAGLPTSRDYVPLSHESALLLMF
jgi:hypothetical protein